MTTAADIRDALMGRWPPAEYVHIHEAPQGPAQQGRKIDVLVVSLWQSRGLERDAVEIKVSASDWKRELDNAEKADWWWRHVHRFWVAVPAGKLADRVASELPSAWGLIAVDDDGTCRTVVKAPKNDPEPLPWPALVGALRAASGAGAGALMRAEQRGYSRGREVGRLDAEARSGDTHLRTQLEMLRADVKAFEEASGLSITDRFEKPERLGELVALVQGWQRDPDRLLERARTRHRDTAAAVARLGEVLDEVAAALTVEAVA